MIDPMMKLAVWFSRVYSEITSKTRFSTRVDLLTEVRTVSGKKVVPNGVYYSPMPIIGIQPLSIEDILAPHQETIQEIVKRSGLTSTSKKFTPDKLIREVIWKTAEYIHLLPASEDYHHSDAGGLLSHSLEVAKMALGEAYNSDLPAKTYPDLEILRRTRYFYAVFISALLHDIGKVFSDVRVFCVDNHIQWQPRLEPLTQWAVKHNVTSYRVEYVKGRGKRHERAASYVLSAVLTNEAKEYILGCQTDDIFAEIDDSITHYTERDGYINQALRRADSASTLKDIQGRHLKETGRREYSLSTHFIRATQQLTPEWTVNQKGSMMWVIGGDIYIAYPQAIIEIMEAIKSVGVNCPNDVNVVCNQMIEQHFIEPSDLQTRSAFWMSGDYTEDDAMKIQHDMVVGKKRAVWTSIVKLKSVHYAYGSLAIPQSMPGLLCLSKAGDMALYRKGELYIPVELKASDMHDRIKAEEAAAAAKAAQSKGQDPEQMAQMLAQLPDATRAQIQAMIDSQLPSSADNQSVAPSTSSASQANPPSGSTSTKSAGKSAGRSQKGAAKKVVQQKVSKQDTTAAANPAADAHQPAQVSADGQGNTLPAQTETVPTQELPGAQTDAEAQVENSSADVPLDFDYMGDLFDEYQQMMGGDELEVLSQDPAGHEQLNGNVPDGLPGSLLANQSSGSEADINHPAPAPEADPTSDTPVTTAEKSDEGSSKTGAVDKPIQQQNETRTQQAVTQQRANTPESSNDTVASDVAPRQAPPVKQHTPQELHDMAAKCTQWLWWCADERAAGVMCYRVEGEKVYLRLKLLSNRLMLKQREISYTLKACGMIDPIDPTEAPANQRYTVEFDTEHGREPHCLLNRKACDLMLMTPSQRKRVGVFASPSQKGSAAPVSTGDQDPAPARAGASRPAEQRSEPEMQELEVSPAPVKQPESAQDMEKPSRPEEASATPEAELPTAASATDVTEEAVSKVDTHPQEQPSHQQDAAPEEVVIEQVQANDEVSVGGNAASSELPVHDISPEAPGINPMHDTCPMSEPDNQQSADPDQDPGAEPKPTPAKKQKRRNKKLANALSPLPVEGETDALEVMNIARTTSPMAEPEHVHQQITTGHESESDADATAGINEAALETAFTPAGLHLTDMQELFANIDRYWHRKAEYQRERLVLEEEKATALEANYFARVTADALGFPIEEVAEYRRKIGDKWYYVIPNASKK